MDKRTMNRKINKILFGDRRYRPENRGGILTPMFTHNFGNDDEYEIVIRKKENNSCAGCGCLILIILVIAAVVGSITNNTVSKNSSTKGSNSGSQYSQPAKIVPEERIWTNRKDGREITGTYIDYKDGKASVLRDNGKTVTIPLELLSDEDREYIKSIRKQEE